MILWIDAQLPPSLAPWLRDTLGIEAYAVRDLGLRDASDHDIFHAARAKNAVVCTKDRDFTLLLQTHGPPPWVIWLTCGNTSNARLKQILVEAIPVAVRLIEGGEPLVEIGDRW